MKNLFSGLLGLGAGLAVGYVLTKRLSSEEDDEEFDDTEELEEVEEVGEVEIVEEPVKKTVIFNHERKVALCKVAQHCFAILTMWSVYLAVVCAINGKEGAV